MAWSVDKIRCGAPLLGLFVWACGGASGGGPAASSPGESGETVVAVVITPTQAERDGGGSEVVINSTAAVDDWVHSPVFGSSGWMKNEDQSAPRYLVSFQGRSGEVARYYIGTVRGESVEYRCFGLCAKWWVAPAASDGSQDILRYRLLTDDAWHPLAREWYMFSEYGESSGGEASD